ncbi:response regulator transcription factor [Streptomyces sp. Ru72]|uniref:response regulator transcription factor n=1 Tax=Streptomyces sp. Ru72 TaxID=2080747 RepID=UPI000CDD500A|nr:response regulator transcription factor [Streptomyces sp. Ru72]POX45232.1 DNA-binding response regulator [Streptomyces sp. Ru72]
MRVLVIEDVRGLAAAIAHGLAEEGFVARVVHDGVDGLWRAVHESYDVILLDLMLPGISGYEVLKRLRAASVWTPVLVLSAKDGEYDEADALDLGADDYLSKPFSYVVLVARLRALLRRGAPARPVVLAAGDLALDPARRHCRRAGREIALTAREFTLLEFLLRHPDEVISKTDILDHVWDENFDGDTNIVEVYIGYLRRKIDTPFGRRTIETVRGAGYRLHATGR